MHMIQTSTLYAVSRGVLGTTAAFYRTSDSFTEHKHLIGKENGEGTSDESSDHEDTSEPMSVTAAADGSFFLLYLRKNLPAN